MDYAALKVLEKLMDKPQRGRDIQDQLKADLSDFNALKRIVAMKPSFVMGFPPCTDLAVSGAAHFASKRAANPNFQNEAVNLALSVRSVGLMANCPWFFENPVSVLSTIFRKPDHIFHPYEYGGYLPENDTHPRWPDYIAPRDSYPKKTCIWAGGGFIMPEKRPVGRAEGYSAQHRKLGGKSEKTKQIRSETPRGFARAVFRANKITA